MIDFITDDGLVINKNDFGEADRYITVFTQNFGKLTFLMKGIRKSKKREISAVDTLALSKFNFYKKGESYVVSNFQGIDSYYEIKEKFDNLGLAIYILSILNTILVENGRKKKLYNITVKSLNFLKDSDDIKTNYILVAYYLYYVIQDEGLKITIGEGLNFSFDKSTFLSETQDFTLRFTKEQKQLITYILCGKIKEIDKSKYSIKDIEKAIELFEKYLNYHFDVEIKFKNCIMGA